jgi:hypothetical protein
MSSKNKELLRRLVRLEDKVFPYIRRPTICVVNKFCKLVHRELILDDPEKHPAEIVERARAYPVPANYEHMKTHIIPFLMKHANERAESDPEKPRSWPNWW